MSVVAARGFCTSAVAAGLKAPPCLDLALVATDDARAVPAAAVFTSNRATAAPVQVSRAHLAATGQRVVGVVLSAGNANAATGTAGLEAARAICTHVGHRLGAEAAHVLICQTGLIGVPFPLHLVTPVVGELVDGRAATVEAAGRAASAIMTTDTVRKEVAVTGRGFSVGGMGKGAAMLAPDMATMLAVLTTDAACEPVALQELLSGAVRSSFNRLNVDGSTSTNDTVVLLASGRAGSVGTADLRAAVTEACIGLAEQMAADAEGATKVVQVRVDGARSDEEARQAARRVAGSLLVKCSLNGEDPYWGRVVSELGAAGVDFELDRVSVAYGGVAVCRGGVTVEHDAAAVAEHMAGTHVELQCDLGLGHGSGAVLTTDLGYGYLDENRTTS